jgi:hypothetical protein
MATTSEVIHSEGTNSKDGGMAAETAVGATQGLGANLAKTQNNSKDVDNIPCTTTYDKYNVPVNVQHSAVGKKHKVYRYFRMLSTPVKKKSLLCVPCLEALSTAEIDEFTWKSCAMTDSNTSNLQKHLIEQHKLNPSETRFHSYKKQRIEASNAVAPSNPIAAAFAKSIAISQKKDVYRWLLMQGLPYNITTAS